MIIYGICDKSVDQMSLMKINNNCAKISETEKLCTFKTGLHNEERAIQMENISAKFVAL